MTLNPSDLLTRNPLLGSHRTSPPQWLERRLRGIGSWSVSVALESRLSQGRCLLAPSGRTPGKPSRRAPLVEHDLGRHYAGWWPRIGSGLALPESRLVCWRYFAGSAFVVVVVYLRGTIVWCTRIVARLLAQLRSWSHWEISLNGQNLLHKFRRFGMSATTSHAYSGKDQNLSCSSSIGS